MITQSKGGKEAPPFMKPSYSGGNKQATGEETRFMDFFKLHFLKQQVAPSRAVSRMEKSSSSAEKKNILNQCLQLKVQNK